MDEPRQSPEAGPAPAQGPSDYAELRRKPVVARRPVWRSLALLSATLLALAAGAAYLWQWLLGVRGLELLRFTSMYLCIPLGLSLLLLFAALQKRPPG
jgi:hypothetical protein